MADRPMVIPFHELGKKYFWNKASGEVRNANNELVARECWNLQMARSAVKR